MPLRSRVLTWNGKDAPTELRDLPVGRYVVEAVEDEAPALTPEEGAGIEAALDTYRQVAWLMPWAPARSSTQPSDVEGHLYRRAGRRHRPGDHLFQRAHRTAAAKLDADIARCLECLADRERV